jgi:LAO/AO transport system kinase
MLELIERLKQHDKRALARCISLVENEADGYEHFLQSLPISKSTPVIGVTGPPGAGKSTLINALANHLAQKNKRIAILAIDPSSPFTRGSIMGDRIRMSEHFLNPYIFIRSMAARGSLGGLAPKLFEVVDVCKAADFDYILIETVGVGQSEVEIAALADITLLVLVPEAGDDIQAIKSGIMEIADAYIVNKADRDGADTYFKNLAALTHQYHHKASAAPVLKTIASKNEGTEELANTLETLIHAYELSNQKIHLLAERALMMIKSYRTKNIRLSDIEDQIRSKIHHQNFNFYQFVASIANHQQP